MVSGLVSSKWEPTITILSSYFMFHPVDLKNKLPVIVALSLVIVSQATENNIPVYETSQTGP